MGNRAIERLLRVLDTYAAALRRDESGVAYLPARFGVERRALEKDLDRVALARRLVIFAGFADSRDPGVGLQLAVPAELGLRHVLGECPSVQNRVPRALALRGHLRLDTAVIDLAPALSCLRTR